MHPSLQTLYNLLRRANPDDLPANTRATLENILKTCQACARHAPRMRSFNIRDTDKLQFNHEILLDIMYHSDGTLKQIPVCISWIKVLDSVQRPSFPPSMLILYETPSSKPGQHFTSDFRIRCSPIRYQCSSPRSWQKPVTPSPLFCATQALKATTHSEQVVA